MQTATNNDWALAAPVVGPDETGSYQQSRLAFDSWKQSVRRAMSRGDVSLNEATTLGYTSSGHDSPYQGGGWRQLPPVLYHVTTAASEVARVGLKSRRDLKQADGVGLGGGEDDTISFTTSRETALDIFCALTELRAVVRGERTVNDLVNEARSGVGAKEPFLKTLLHFANFGPVEEGRLPLKLELLMRGRALTQELLTSDEVPAGWRPAPGVDGITIKGRPAFFLWDRPLPGPERIYRQTQVARAFLSAREFAGGREDPHFFCADFEALGRTAKRDLQVLKFAPLPEAQGYPVSSLSEWRTCDGSAVRLVGRELVANPLLLQ